MKDRFTRVLKGHIAIATAVFPKGTSGARIDAFARRPLWEIGLDFDHGTGHGIGSYLSVHQGPQRISALGNVPLEPGMIVSNEPGYYKAGEYGIRIENLILVEKRAIEGADREFFGFETLVACADRPFPGGPGLADTRGDGLAQRLPWTGARGALPSLPRSRTHPSYTLARRGHATVVVTSRGRRSARRLSQGCRHTSGRERGS